MSGPAVHEAGQGPAVLLIHGLGADHQDWRFQVPALARHHRVLAVDLPGFGASPPMPRLRSLEDYAQAVLAALAARGVAELAAVVGHSLGGAVAQALVLAAPGRVRRLVLANTLLSFKPEGLRQRFELGYRALLSAFLPMTQLARVGAWRMFPAPEQAPLREAVIARGKRNRRGPYRQALRALARWDARPRAAALALPVLWLAAEQDYFPRAWVEAMAAALPDARLHWFDARHGLPLERPDAVNRALLDFLADGG